MNKKKNTHKPYGKGTFTPKIHTEIRNESAAKSTPIVQILLRNYCRFYTAVNARQKWCGFCRGFIVILVRKHLSGARPGQFATLTIHPDDIAHNLLPPSKSWVHSAFCIYSMTGFCHNCENFCYKIVP